MLAALLDDDARERYLDTDEWRDKAGGYGIQGLASIFISNISGSYTGIMGLPVYETAELLANAGLPVFNAQSVDRLQTVMKKAR